MSVLRRAANEVRSDRDELRCRGALGNADLSRGRIKKPGCDDAVDYSDCVELADRTILATAEIQIAVAAQSRRSTGRNS